VLPFVVAAMLADSPVPSPAVEAWPAEESEEHVTERIVLGGHSVPSLVAIDPLVVRIAPDDPPVGDETTHGSAVVQVIAEVEHELDATVIDLQLGVAILPRRSLDVIWDRLHAPALRVLPTENDEPLPSPSASVSGGIDGRLRRGEPGEIEIREEIESLPLSRAQSLSYLVAIGGYELESPSVDDVVRILEHGGPIDLSALATWATQAAAEDDSPFDDEERGRIMDSVELGARALRAPPGWGDFGRLVAFTAVAHACARSEDLERMLALQRPMGIMLASGMVSWDAAATEEHTVGVAIHGFSVEQSRTQAAISWELALKRLRTTALDRLLRLAYDPIDFRNAPATMRRSPLQSLAGDLLAPLGATQVERVLATAAHEATEAAILRYYIEVRHEAVAEPLVDWLIEHPDRVEDIGAASLGALGEAILPVLLRRHGEVDASQGERELLWRLLDALPERLAGPLAQAAHSLGVDVPADADGVAPSIADVLSAIRRNEENMRASRADELVSRVQEQAVDRASLRIRIRAAGQLAEIGPERMPAIADALIELHTRAALEFDEERPGELQAVLRQLIELPLGDRVDDAERAAVLTRAEIAMQHGQLDVALAELEAQDPDLVDPRVRDLYARVVRREVQNAMGARDFARAEEAIARAEAHVSDLVDVAGMRIELARKRNFPLIVGGAALVVLLSAAGGWLLIKLAAARRRRARAREREHEASPSASKEDAVAHREQSDRGGDRGGDPGTECRGFDEWHTAREVERRTHSPLDDFGAAS
jgi:hypothetical protein